MANDKGRQHSEKGSQRMKQGAGESAFVDNLDARIARKQDQHSQKFDTQEDDVQEEKQEDRAGTAVAETSDKDQGARKLGWVDQRELFDGRQEEEFYPEIDLKQFKRERRSRSRLAMVSSSMTGRSGSRSMFGSKRRGTSFSNPNSPVADTDVIGSTPIDAEERTTIFELIDKRNLCVGAVIVLIVILAVTIPLVIFLGNTERFFATPASREQFQTALSSVTDQSTFAITKSPQSLALDWLMLKDPERLRLESENLVQRYCLMVLFFEAGGSGWDFEGESWIGGAPECEWEFVTCINNKVTRIEAVGKSVSGTLPSEVGGLSDLNVFDLSDNQISGSIPESIYEMTRLERLELNNNELVGTISEQIGQLSNLNNLELFDNDLSGSVPSSISNLKKMVILDFGFNLFEGEILDYLMVMTDLESLVLKENSMDGTIPDGIGGLSDLGRLSLEGNDFSGSLPSVIGGLTKLSILDLRHNVLNFTIPTEVGNLLLLDILLFDTNSFSGMIPTEIGMMGELVFIHIESNQLSGPIPTSFGQLSKVQHIFASNNLLTGTVPSVLGMLPSLRAINLVDNRLEGSIPSELCTLPLEGFFVDCFLVVVVVVIAVTVKNGIEADFI
eukprot:CAMPEP_0118676720 /NCGR_PEP_ID=MMETSP0800-20121206/2207_1 /TAXON_ID=210618 ORGANISM="Striatella unipunctata, Strain CCMP2910" /NCGR_SAMPLE_ID=MMETSP0800 /ASSEMBLY_ACC=CAM_ASM_000638 /LENGTH=615 /DNA_ID=CAMNT_0006572271 /DNA_START=44 /DNA_END=1892 /DNA_ORIENTATION=+